jgi:pyrroloquinoline quinone biosynthesis protein B
MRIRVLGSAAGGGFPQWNCGCVLCRDARAGVPGVLARTQASLAVAAEDGAWLLLGVSPEIRTQLEAFPALHPRATRDSPVAGLALANGDLDHVLGLLSLRESHPLRIFATSAVRRGLLDGNVLFRTLDRFPGQSTWTDLPLGEEVPVVPGLALTAVPTPGKVPVHLEGLTAPSPEDSVALVVRSQSRVLVFAPSVASPTPALSRVLLEADAVFFDGTFWAEDEMERAGTGHHGARTMAHWPVGGSGGSLEMLATLPARHRFLIHVNNTNRILRDSSAERAAVRAAGVEVAEDGMELTL